MEILLEVLKAIGIPALISAVIPILIVRGLDKKDKRKDDIAELKISRKEYEKIQKEMLNSMHRIEDRFELYEDAIQSLLRERIEHSTVPKYFKGMPIVFIMAGILSLAFMGFSGMVK